MGGNVDELVAVELTVRDGQAVGGEARPLLIV